MNDFHATANYFSQSGRDTKKTSLVLNQMPNFPHAIYMNQIKWVGRKVNALAWPCVLILIFSSVCLAA